jgi:putative ABC transport system substrate-binding protein
MKSGWFGGLLAGLMALAPLASAPPADAQQAAAPRRIGILESGWARTAPAREPVIEALGSLGWVEGQNLAVERRFAQGRYNRLAILATELLRAKVDVLVPIGADAARAAREATATVPIVFVAVPSPTRLLPIQSLAKPGGNITGSSFDLPQSEFAKLPRLLHEVAPQVFRQGVLWDPTSPGMSQAVLAAYYSQEEARLNFRAFEIRSAPDLEMAFEKIRVERVRAVFILPSPATVTYRAGIIDFMTKNKIPAIYPSREFVEAGGLMAYGPSMADAQAQAAELVDHVLKGANPGDLPIRIPVRFQPVTNLWAARAIDLTLPQSLLDRSEKIGE